MSRGKTIIVKFRSAGDPRAQLDKIRLLIGSVLERVGPLFPEDKSDELATLYEVVLTAEASVKNAISTLAQDPQIEYAHEPSPRRPQ